MGVEGPGLDLETTLTTRRRFLRDAAAVGGALVGGPAFMAATAAAATAAKPKRGGALNVGISGGGASDTMNGFAGVSNIDLARSCQLYESLVDYTHDFGLVPRLATEFIPSKTGTSMSVKLRKGVLFHNGKPMTADDVVYSYRYMLDLKNITNVGPLLAAFTKSVDKIDASTVLFNFKFPFNSFEDFAVLPGAPIVPVGYLPKQSPIGTGPFKFQSFTPGQQSVFVRNPHYWGVDPHGNQLPYVDSVTIHDLSDDAARVNALVSGAVEAVDNVPFALLPSVKANNTIAPLVSQTGNWYPITMRVDQAPFNDVRVRQAFRLMVDRPQLVQVAYGGEAALGNDLFANTDSLYDHSIPQRVQDIEQAKSLLKKAGRSNMTVQLVTAPISAGVVESCVVFAQQAKAAGVTVQLSKLDNTAFYNDQYLKRPFSVDTWPTFQFVVDVAYSCGPGATYNDTHWNNAQFTKWYFELVGTQSPSLKQEIANKMQELLWNEGGEIIAGIPNEIDGYSKKVTGFVPDKSGEPLSYYRFKNVSFV